MPPPLTISSSTNSPSAATTAARRAGQLGGRAALHEADRGPAQAPARRPVADAGDLPLVGHQRVEFDLRAALDLAGQLDRLLDGVDRRALRADLDPPAQRPPAGVEVDADANRRRAGPQHRLDHVEVLDAVDHQDRRPAGLAAERSASSPSALGVGGRVGEQQVLEALLGQPQGLGQGEGHQPGEALVAVAGSPPAGPGSGPTCWRRGSACRRRVPASPPRWPTSRRGRRRRMAPRPQRRSARSGRGTGWAAHGHPRQPIPAVPGYFLQSTRTPGEVAEWLKALAC